MKIKQRTYAGAGDLQPMMALAHALPADNLHVVDQPYRDPVFAHKMTQMQGLADWWKERAIERSENLKEHWMATMKDSVTE